MEKELLREAMKLLSEINQLMFDISADAFLSNNWLHKMTGKRADDFIKRIAELANDAHGYG